MECFMWKYAVKQSDKKLNFQHSLDCLPAPVRISSVEANVFTDISGAPDKFLL